MKLVKLSLVAALAAGTFSVTNAASLEEAIKDIDISGMLRYRYDTSNKWRGNNGDRPYGTSGRSGKQTHKYRTQLNFSAAIADNFKTFVQFDYAAGDDGHGSKSYSNTSEIFSLRQFYLNYTDDTTATSVIFGKQELGAIWTDDLIGSSVKVINNDIDGLTLVALVADNYNVYEPDKVVNNEIKRRNPNGDGDESALINWKKNLYGAAVMGSYDVLNGQLDSQLWLGYMVDNATLYALSLAYNTTVFDSIDWTLEGAYSGNSLDSKLKSGSIDGQHADNSNFFLLRGSVKVDAWDASLGGTYYGNDSKMTVVAIEDQGRFGDLLGGKEIFYTDGSRLNGDLGKNMFGWITAGYTFDEIVRLGADFVYGTTTTGSLNNGGKKLEAVASVSYKYSPKLSFSAFYSYVKVDKDPETLSHDFVRLQALYMF